VFDGVTGAMIANFMAFPVSFTGGVRVAAADVNGDGDADIIAGEGPGTGGPLVSVFSGRAVLQGNDTPLSTFQAFNDSYTGGVFVAAGDVVSNSRADVVVGMGGDGPPLVEVFNGNSGILLDSFLAFDASFTGGVRVAVGALDANGLAEIIAGAGAGGQSQVNIFSGPDNTLVESIASNDPNYPGGVYVAGIGS
jgi:serralysin